LNGPLAAAGEIAAAVASGEVAPVEVLARHVAVHRATHARLNALVQPRHAAAAAEVAAVAGLPLAAVPVSVKECFPVRGCMTTLGIPGRDRADDHDAEIVVRLRRAGAVIVGKANVPQAMYLHETDNTVWGRTNHPLAADRGPGGSSGGDAALVAAGVVPLAVGTDLAGSIRQPAHACGIAGLLPRTTALGEAGAFDTVPHLEVVRPRAGFLARSVSDLALAHAALVRRDDASGLSPPPRRVGWWTDAGVLAPSPAIRRGVHEAVAALAAGGYETIRLDGALGLDAAWILLAILSADGGADIRRLVAGTRPIAGVARLLRLARLPRPFRSWLAALAELTGRRIEAAALRATGPRAGAALEDLLAARAALAGRLQALAAGCDAIVCPVSALPALRHGSAASLLPAAFPCLLANLFDLAAGTVPVTSVRPEEEQGRLAEADSDPIVRMAAVTDRGSRGLPVGVQVIALSGGESTVLTVMAAIETGCGQPARRATSDLAI